MNVGMRAIFSTISAVSPIFVLTVAAFVVGAQPAQAVPYGIPDITDPSDAETIPAPLDLRVEESLPRVIEVRWNSAYRSIFGISDAGENYIVEVSSKADGSLVYSEELTERTLVLEDLDDNSAYVVTVRAERGGVLSDPVEIVARTSPRRVAVLKAESSVQSVPRDVISNKPLVGRGGVAGGKYAAYLKWAGSEGKIRYYSVDVYAKGGAEVLTTVTSKKKSARVDGLVGGRYYEYTVRAHFNDDYASPASGRKTFWVGKKQGKK